MRVRNPPEKHFVNKSPLDDVDAPATNRRRPVGWADDPREGSVAITSR